MYAEGKKTVRLAGWAAVDLQSLRVVLSRARVFLANAAKIPTTMRRIAMGTISSRGRVLVKARNTPGARPSPGTKSLARAMIDDILLEMWVMVVVCSVNVVDFKRLCEVWM